MTEIDVCSIVSIFERPKKYDGKKKSKEKVTPALSCGAGLHPLENGGRPDTIDRLPTASKNQKNVKTTFSRTAQLE